MGDSPLLACLYVLEIITELNWYFLRILLSKEVADNQLTLFKSFAAYFRKDEADRSLKLFLEHISRAGSAVKRLLISLIDALTWWIKSDHCIITDYNNYNKFRIFDSDC